MKTKLSYLVRLVGSVLVSTGVVLGTEPNTLSDEERAAGWEMLFDGRSLNGWRASESAASFRVVNGTIVGEGPRSHLYYTGPVGGGEFVDFEFSVEVMTSPGTNSGIYFHTRWQETGWPALGYEVQINNSDPPGAASAAGASRSGSLWGVADLGEATVRDEKWFTLRIRVEGKRIVTEIDGQVVVDYAEPLVLVRPDHLAGKKLSSGTFALQVADPAGRVRFRSIKTRALGGASTPGEPTATDSGGAFNKGAVSGKTFRMHWMRGVDQGVAGEVTLAPGGTIEGASNEHLARWSIEERGRLAFHARGGNLTVLFESQLRDGQWIHLGKMLIDQGSQVRLDEKLPLPKVLDDEAINRIIRPWSSQEIVGLDPGESHPFKMRDGRTRTIRLLSVEETRDTVVKLVRCAAVRVEIDGTPLDLVCAPYVMPTEIDGLRIQADITSGMVPEFSKQVSFSLWDAADPIVDTKAFTYPLSEHRLFSHDLQAYSEVDWLGVHDGDPKGVTARHAYGIDLAGYEDGVEVLAVADGVVHDVFPDTNDPYAALIRSENGVVWEYGHLHSLLPQIREGVAVRTGQPIGRLGKRGHSGNFSHLHIGLHPSPAHRTAVVRTQRLNFYPWIVAAYRARFPQSLFAIAGPHAVLRAGESASLDASHSIAFDSEIVSHRWIFHDGESAEGARAGKVYREPGVYVAELWVEDREGRKDVDFCRVKVFPARGRTDGIPTLFLTHRPTMGIAPGREVTVRGWVQAEQDAPMLLDFGDGSPPVNYRSYDEVIHRFEKPGLYVVTATATAGGLPVMAKQKILVTADGKLDVIPGGTTAAGEAPRPAMPGTDGSFVESILVGAGRNPDGSLVDPGQPLPETLATISADIEIRHLAAGERVQAWVEKGENRTEPINAVVKGEGSGKVPFDLHLGDAEFPHGDYTFVVMLGERKRFEQPFRIGGEAFRAVFHEKHALRYDLPLDWQDVVGDSEYQLSPKADHPRAGLAWANIRVLPKKRGDKDPGAADLLVSYLQSLPGVKADEPQFSIVQGNGIEITDADQIKEAGEDFDPRTIRLTVHANLSFDDPKSGARWRGSLLAAVPTREKAIFEYLFFFASREDCWDEFLPVFARFSASGIGFGPDD